MFLTWELFQTVSALYVIYRVAWYLLPIWHSCFERSPPKLQVGLTPDESMDVLEGKPKFDPKKLDGESEKVHLWDPSTLDYFGFKPVHSAKEVWTSSATFFSIY